MEEITIVFGFGFILWGMALLISVDRGRRWSRLAVKELEQIRKALEVQVQIDAGESSEALKDWKPLSQKPQESDGWG